MDALLQPKALTARRQQGSCAYRRACRLQAQVKAARLPNHCSEQRRPACINGLVVAYWHICGVNSPGGHEGREEGEGVVGALAGEEGQAGPAASRPHPHTAIR